MTDTTTLLTIEETARILRHSPRTLYEWRKRGFGPAPLDLNGRILYRQSDVESFIARRASQAASNYLAIAEAGRE